MSAPSDPKRHPWSGQLPWLVWGILALALVAYVAHFGQDVPFMDEWEMVPSPDQPLFDPAWLWQQHNEHRIVLPKLLHRTLFLLSGGEYRAGMGLSTLALIALTAVLLATARQLRGHSEVVDAFLPLALLHWGHCENVLSSFQIAFSLSAILFFLAFAVVLRLDEPPEPRRLALIGLLVALLPLTSANGLVLALPLVVWLVVAGRGGVRVIAVVAAVLWGLYFVGYRPATDHPPSHGPLETLKATAYVLATGLGPAGTKTTSIVRLGIGILVLGAVGCALVSLGRRGATARTVGQLCCLASALLLALATGYGRAGYYAGRGGVALIGGESRYALAMAVVPCWLFFAGVLLGRPWLSRLAFLGALALLPWNVEIGLLAGRTRAALMAEFAADARAGMSSADLAARYVGRLHPHEATLTERIEFLRQRREGPFR